MLIIYAAYENQKCDKSKIVSYYWSLKHPHQCVGVLKPMFHFQFKIFYKNNSLLTNVLVNIGLLVLSTSTLCDNIHYNLQTLVRKCTASCFYRKVEYFDVLF